MRHTLKESILQGPARFYVGPTQRAPEHATPMAGADMRAWDKEIEALTPRLYEPTRRRDSYTALNAIELGST
jgi:hypothetical protein